MKLFRFMSKNEFERYLKGEKLTNNTNHNKENNFKTNSIGFCFFNYAHYKPEEILHSLTGIVNFDVCCIFETKRENIIKSYGRYSKAINNNSLKRESFIATEFCTTEYSKNTFNLISYVKPNWYEWKKWEWIKV